MLKSDLNAVSEDPIAFTRSFGSFKAFVRNVLVKERVLQQIRLVKRFVNKKTGKEQEQVIALIPSEAPLLQLCLKDLEKILQKIMRRY